MDTILIQTKNEEEVRLVQSFLQKHKLKARTLTDDDKEDFVLSRLIEEALNDEVIDTDSFLQELKSR